MPDREASRPASGGEPARALTAVRGIAAWWVVAYHFREALPGATPHLITRVIAQGYLAVDLFFVLSGFVIALNYGDWFAAGGRPGAYRRFLWLRLSRIYPLHLAMLAAFLSLPLALGLTGRLHGVTLHWPYFVASLVLVQSWGLTPGLHWNVPAWSISTEWLAYLVFPWLAGAAYATAVDRRTALVGILLLAALLAVICGRAGGLNADAASVAIARCLAEFTMGILLCRYRAGAPASDGVVTATIIALVAVAATLALGLPDYLLMPLAFAALVHAFADEGSAAARLLRAAPLQALGVVSYSTYLCHYLLKSWVKIALVRPGVPPGLVFAFYLAAVLVASFLLFRAIERPAQRALRRIA